MQKLQMSKLFLNSLAIMSLLSTTAIAGYKIFSSKTPLVAGSTTTDETFATPEVIEQIEEEIEQIPLSTPTQTPMSFEEHTSYPSGSGNNKTAFPQPTFVDNGDDDVEFEDDPPQDGEVELVGQDDGKKEIENEEEVEY